MWRGLLVGMIVLLAITPGWAQAWQSAVAIGQVSGASSDVSAVATDAAGDVYLAGTFSGAASFGNLGVSSAGGSDGFIAKWSAATGSFAWVRALGAGAEETVTSLAVEGTTLIVGGTFYGAITSIGGTILTNANAARTDLFVARYSTAGTFAWALKLGGAADEFIGRSSLALRGGSIYLTGSFSQTAIFGAASLAALGSNDMFVVKLSDAGTVVWAQRGGGSESDSAMSLALSGTAVYVQGSTLSQATDFGGLNATGTGPIVLAKLTDNGTTASFSWAVRTGGTSFISGGELAVSGSSLYLVGAYAGAGATFGAVSLPAPAVKDAFVVKFTDTGATALPVWAQRGTGTGQNVAATVVSSGTDVFVAGWFSSSALTWGSLSVANTGTAPSMNVFVAKLTDLGSSGQFSWLQQGGGPTDDNASALAVRNGDVWLGGRIGINALFGNTVLTAPSNGVVGFLARLNDLTLATKTAKAADLALFPNPARAAVRVRVPAGAAEVTVLDLAGRTARAVPTNVGQPETLVSLRGLAPGSYLLRAGAATGKLVVE